MSVAAHYRKKLEKEDIKRLSKEVRMITNLRLRLLISLQVAKKLVRGDYKSGRVKDPTAKLSSRHEKTVKNYVKEFMDKAVKKKEERDKQKASRQGDGKADSPATMEKGDNEVDWDDDMMDIQKDLAASHDVSPTGSTSELKRKREGNEDPTSPKKTRTEADDSELQVVPPPPPPPPTDAPLDADDSSTLENPNGLSKGPIFENGYPSPMQLATPSTNGSHQTDLKTDSHENSHGS